MTPRSRLRWGREMMSPGTPAIGADRADGTAAWRSVASTRLFGRIAGLGLPGASVKRGAEIEERLPADEAPARSGRHRAGPAGPSLVLRVPRSGRRPSQRRPRRSLSPARFARYEGRDQAVAEAVRGSLEL